MKSAVILHGTGAGPESNWSPWLKGKLEADGYEVWVPQLPQSHTPNAQINNDFLFDSAWDFSDNLIVGHSAGAVEILNLLMDDRCPKIKAAVLVSAWEHGYPNGDEWEAGQFDGLFPAAGFDYEKIRSNCSSFAMLHAEYDPYCPLKQAQSIAGSLQASLKVLPVTSHLGADYSIFPELWDIIQDV